MRLRSKLVLVAAVVSLLAFAVAAPAIAQGTAEVAAPGLAGGLCRGVGAVAQQVADLLGMSTDDVAQAREDGKSLSQLADEKGVAQDELIETMLAPRKAMLDQAVADGRLTQAEADAMLERMRSRLTQKADGAQAGGGCGGPGAGAGSEGCGGPGGGGGGCGAGPNAPTTSL